MLISKSRRDRGSIDLRVSDVSLSFDGVTEGLQNTSNNALGIENSYSILWTFKATANTDSTRLFVARNTSTDRGEILVTYSSLAGSPFRISIRNNENDTGIKSYEWENVVTVNSWHNFIFTWDGTNIKLYIDGTLTAPTTMTLDSGVTQGDRPRAVGIGYDADEDLIDSWVGNIHQIIIWNTVLSQAQVTAAIVANYNPYLTDTSAFVKHWWRLGLPTIGGMAGSTYVCDAVSSGGIDVSVNAVNMSDADIIADSP